MAQRFRLGLVVGKFSPLHRGHEELIRRAQDDCAEIIILSYSYPEFAGCEASRREAWLEELFPGARCLVVTNELLRRVVDVDSEFTAVPSNEAAEATHRAFCGFVVEIFTKSTVDAVFTGEAYGAGFAAHLAERWGSPVEHVIVDRKQILPLTSATDIRQNVHEKRHWLSPCVYASFVQRVCILGGESSGKSVLARDAASRFETAFVSEYGRELWMMKQGRLVFEDMLAIAERQVEWEQSAARNAVRYLFCDTSPLTTLFYSLDLFGRADTELERLALRQYDAYVLCAPDFEFVQDGTRRSAEFRQRQHQWYLEQLQRLGVDYLLAQGSVEQRLNQIAAHLYR